MRTIALIVLTATLSLTLPIPGAGGAAWAQGSSRAGGGGKGGGPKKQLTIIVFSGLAGAILGLSTLSFYGRPQDRLSNIAVGFALGIISGTIYTTYQAAARPKDFYRGNNSTDAETWTRLAATEGMGIQAPTPMGLRYDF